MQALIIQVSVTCSLIKLYVHTKLALLISLGMARIRCLLEWERRKTRRCVAHSKTCLPDSIRLENSIEGYPYKSSIPSAFLTPSTNTPCSPHSRPRRITFIYDLRVHRCNAELGQSNRSCRKRWTKYACRYPTERGNSDVYRYLGAHLSASYEPTFHSSFLLRCPMMKLLCDRQSCSFPPLSTVQAFNNIEQLQSPVFRHVSPLLCSTPFNAR